MRKKKQKFDLYFVKNVNQPFIENNPNVPYILSVVTSKKEAIEYIRRKLLLDNKEHFESWCSFKNLPINEISFLYYLKIVKPTNPYIYFKVASDISSTASLLRLFYGCAPIGCSFDTKIEQINALIHLPKETLEDIDNQLKELNH